MEPNRLNVKVISFQALSVPTSHSQHDLPIIVAGGAAGRIKGGRYLKFPGDETPLTNLYLTMLDKVGVATEKRR